MVELRFSFKVILVIIVAIVVLLAVKPFFFSERRTEENESLEEDISAYYKTTEASIKGILDACELTHRTDVEFLYPIRSTSQSGGFAMIQWEPDKVEGVVLQLWVEGDTTYGNPIFCVFKQYPEEYIGKTVNLQGTIRYRRIRVPGEGYYKFNKSVFVLFVETVTLTE
ncbi:hypothetical protein DRO34_02690 [Candidatus Bathyarchaeota archaeon]|nr:MAG: hypothetical protein DRO34_02690 [Candidatus Bathyarchaeota archaeon]RLI27168.1 MAG: hypothetical protein DRO50_04840 [Candidatus Bathyarchaeota archaeon]